MSNSYDNNDSSINANSEEKNDGMKNDINNNNDHNQNITGNIPTAESSTVKEQQQQKDTVDNKDTVIKNNDDSTSNFNTKNSNTKGHHENDNDNYYDCIIYGTGLVQSIVASALSRANKKVFHCDTNDFYGQYDTVFTYQYLVNQINLYNTRNNTINNTNDANNTSKQPKPIVENNCSKSTKIQFKNVNDNNNSNMFRYISSNQVTYQPTISCNMIVMTKYGYAKVIRISPISDSKSKSEPISISDNTENPSLYIVELILLVASKSSSLTSNLSYSLSGTSILLSVPYEYIQLVNDNDSNDNTTITINSEYMYTKFGIESMYNNYIRTVLYNNNRSIAIDISCQLVFASLTDITVSSLITSGVADYLDFKSCEGLFLYTNNNTTSNTTTNSNKNITKLSRVPCSKNDIFSSKDLSPMDKRRLMKFLQLTYDYGILLQYTSCNEISSTTTTTGNTNGSTSTTSSTSTIEESVTNDADNTTTTTTTTTSYNNNNEDIIKSKNERQLNQGRSLGRPQNKAILSNEMQTLQKYIQQSSVTFEQYLQKEHKLTSSIIQLVRYALSLESLVPTTSTSTVTTTAGSSINLTSTSTSTSSNSIGTCMKRLCQHMSSLGQYGTTGFLIPMYGTGELSSSFCRSAAVYGATYILRCSIQELLLTTTAPTTTDPTTVSPTVVEPDDNVDVNKNDITNTTTVHGVIVSMDDNKSSTTTEIDPTPKIIKSIYAPHVIVPAQSLIGYGNKRNNTSTSNNNTTAPELHNEQVIVVRRVSVLSGKPWFPQDTCMTNLHNVSVPSQQQIRNVIIIPPGTQFVITNSNSSTTVNENDNNDLSQPVTVTNPATIHAIFLDESMQVVPNVTNIGCTIVHLTTTTTIKGSDDTTADIEASKILHYALQSILHDCRFNAPAATTTATIVEEMSIPVQEIFHTEFTYEVDNEIHNKTQDYDTKTDLPNGLHIIHRHVPSFTCDDAFEDAKRLYYKIMMSSHNNNNNNNNKKEERKQEQSEQVPEFLQLSETLLSSIQERFGTNVTSTGRDTDDDIDQQVLERAVEMIASSSSAAVVTAAATAATQETISSP